MKTDERILKLEEENLALRKSIEERDQLFSIIAHDLRGPLGGFLGLTEIMSDDLSDMKLTEIQRNVDTLKKSASVVYQLLENLLEWAQLHNGSISFDPREILLGNKVKEIVKSLSLTAEKKWIELEILIPEDLTVNADDNMVRSIFYNLISNAIKFTPKRGLVSISAQKEGDKVSISVKDTGIGMDDYVLGNLFVFNGKSKRPGTDGEPSTGLGLALCKDLIGMHKSELRVKSEKNIGSEFFFSLPACVE